MKRGKSHSVSGSAKLYSAKCATRLEALGIPHATLEHEVHLSTPLRRALSALPFRLGAL